MNKGCEFIDRTGEKHYTFTFIERVFKPWTTNKRKVLWRIRCDLCGKERTNRPIALRKTGPCICQKVPKYKTKKVIKEPKKAWNFIDKTGEQYGNFTVVSFAHREKERTYWKCCCNRCKEEMNIDSNRLNVNYNILCNTCDRSPKDSVPYYYYSGCRDNAKKRGIDFNVSIEHCREVFAKQNKCCALSGVPLQFSHSSKIRILTTASLDRIDSKGGYWANNIQWLHKDINTIKWDYKQEEFLEFVKQIYEKNF